MGQIVIEKAGQCRQCRLTKAATRVMSKSCTVQTSHAHQCISIMHPSDESWCMTVHCAGVYNPNSLKVAFGKTYRAGTGDPRENKGHTVEYRGERNLAPGQACCYACLLYTSPSPRDRQKSRMPSSA